MATLAQRLIQTPRAGRAARLRRGLATAVPHLILILFSAIILLPLLCFRYGIGAAAVSAGTALGYLAYQGFPSSNWFWYEKESGNPFPMYMVFIAVILIGAWLAFRAGHTHSASDVRLGLRRLDKEQSKRGKPAD